MLLTAAIALCRILYSLTPLPNLDVCKLLSHVLFDLCTKFFHLPPCTELSSDSLLLKSSPRLVCSCCIFSSMSVALSLKALSARQQKHEEAQGSTGLVRSRCFRSSISLSRAAFSCQSSLWTRGRLRLRRPGSTSLVLAVLLGFFSELLLKSREAGLMPESQEASLDPLRDHV